MSDTATVPSETEQQEAVEQIIGITKKGFDLTARLKGRGLRKATITLFLEDELGLELGWAYDARDQLGNVMLNQATGKAVRIRHGVEGDLDLAQIELESILNPTAAQKVAESTGLVTHDETETRRKDVVANIKKLEKRRDELTAELVKTGLTIQMRAVPPIIQKDTRRLARQTMGITEKSVPEDKQVDFNLCQLAHLMTFMFQTVTDNATGEVNEGIDYDDAVELMGQIPVGQYDRLNAVIGQVQFTDAISRSIEGQEDFS